MDMDPSAPRPSSQTAGSALPASTQASHARWLELLLVAAAAAGVAALLDQFDAFDRFYQATRAHESWELDELVLSLPFLCLGLLVYCARRVRELRAEVARRAEAEVRLLEANTRLAEAQQLREEFLRSAAHELRTPLSGAAAMLAMLARSGLADRQQEYAGHASQAVKRLSALLDNLLDLSRHQAGGPPPLNEFSPADLARSALDLHSYAAWAKGLDLSLSADVPDLLVGMEAALHQILVNLVGNAVKFTSAGAVTVTLSFQPRGPSGAGVLTVTVRDSGPGIPAHLHTRIFDPYYRLDEESSGLGLGLSLVKRTAELAGGSVEAESGLPDGAAFTARLPMALPEPPQPDQPPAA